MALTSAYTISEARDMLALWKECERALATGQAKSYKIGSREYVAFDLPEVRAQISRFAAIVEQLTGTAKARTRRIVPRDL